MCVYMYVCMYVCIYIYIYIYMSVCVCVLPTPRPPTPAPRPEFPEEASSQDSKICFLFEKAPRFVFYLRNHIKLRTKKHEDRKIVCHDPVCACRWFLYRASIACMLSSTGGSLADTVFSGLIGMCVYICASIYIYISLSLSLSLCCYIYIYI